MDTGRGAEVIERQARATFSVQFVKHAREPVWSLLSVLKWKPCREACDFSKQALHAQRICLLNSKGFLEELHRQPKERAATSVFASPVKLAGALRKPRFPAGPQFNVEEPQATGRNFILVWYASGPEHQRHRRKLLLLAAIEFAVKTTEQQSEKGQIMRMHWQLARNRMAQIAEDRPGILQAVADGAEELPALQAGFAVWNRLHFSHGDSDRGKMLLLF
jgi:hypothetical protein